jgi:SAM-dependent methyltransferase
MQSRFRSDERIGAGLAYAVDERLAPHYERHMLGECRYRTPQVVAGVLADLIGSTSPDPLACAPLWLDVGAGTGLVGRALRSRSICFALVAVDISPAMLEQIDCPSYVARHCADVTGGLPFAGAAFDGVVAVGLLEHLIDPEPLFEETARVLKPGGAFLFTFPPSGAEFESIEPRLCAQSEPRHLEEGLISHDPVTTHASLARFGLSVVREIAFPAYVSGSHGWVTHHLQSGFEMANAPRGLARSIC